MLRFVGVHAQRPLAGDVLAGFECSRDALAVSGDLHGDDAQVDVVGGDHPFDSHEPVARAELFGCRSGRLCSGRRHRREREQLERIDRRHV